jgi:hypothetical protein
MNKVVSSGTVPQGGLSIQSPASPDSDGFTVLPDGNFLINDGDASPIYREFVAGFVYDDMASTTLIHWDLTQGELGEQSIEINGLADAIEDIDVVIP